MTDDMQDKEFVEYVLKTVVDNPDDVHVDRTIDEMGVLLSVSVNPDDMGKVIGKSGQTAKAIRTLLKVVGAKHDARVNMKIVEPEGSDNGGGSAASASQAADTPVADAFANSDSAVPQPGTTDAADDVPVDERSEGEAIAAQHETDAAMPQPENDNSEVDEATGNPVPQEPRSASEPPVESTPAASETERDRALHEKSPLDEL